MPYVVEHGREVHHSGVVYVAGQEVPAMKGTLADLVADGAVAWRDSRIETTAKRKANLSKRKAVKST